MKWPRAGLVVCVLVALAACGNKPAPLTQQEKRTVNELTSGFMTRCVGRYLIDMPGGMAVSGYAKMQDVDFDVKPMSQEAYRQEIVQREEQLTAIKSIHGYRSIYANGEARGSGTRYFIHLSGAVADAASRVVEAYKWDRGYRFKLTIEGSDFTNPDQTNDPIVRQMTVKNDVPEKTRLVFGLLEKVRGRDDDEIPTEPGLCFSGGFLPGTADDSEFVSTQYVPQDHYDVTFEVMTDPSIREDTSLLKRGAQARDTVKAASGKIIRHGTIDLQSMKADEWLVSGKTDAGLYGFVFALEVNTTTSGRSAPFLSLDMSVGNVKKDAGGNRIDEVSLTEGEAVALWDAVTRSLRVRPNAF
jgi:hypothetical protein